MDIVFEEFFLDMMLVLPEIITFLPFFVIK